MLNATVGINGLRTPLEHKALVPRDLRGSSHYAERHGIAVWVGTMLGSKVPMNLL